MAVTFQLILLDLEFSNPVNSLFYDCFPYFLPFLFHGTLEAAKEEDDYSVSQSIN